jgi:Prp8 binding protein
MNKRPNEIEEDQQESSKRTRYDELAVRPDTSKQIIATPQGVKRTSSLSAPTIQLEGHTGAVYSIAFDSTGQNLASASYDRQICKSSSFEFAPYFLCCLCVMFSTVLWDVYGENSNYNVLTGHKNAVLEVKWNHVAPHQLVSCSADKTVAVWDGNKGQCIRKLTEHKGIVNSVANTRTLSHLLVSGSDDCSALLWDARSKAPVAAMRHSYQVTAVAMHSDGEAVYTGGIDNAIRRFDVRQLGKAVESLQLAGHSDTITGLALSPDNNFLLSNSMDSTVRKWDTRPFVK